MYFVAFKYKKFLIILNMDKKLKQHEMSDNGIFNIIIILNFLILAMSIKTLQSTPATSLKELYNQEHKVYHKKISANEIQDKNNFQYFKVQPKNKRFFERRKLQEEFKGKVYKNNLLDEERVFGKNDQRFVKRWWVHDNNKNEIFLNNNFLNNVSDNFSYRKKYNDAAINNINKYYDNHIKEKYKYNSVNLFDKDNNNILMNRDRLTAKPKELKAQIERRYAFSNNDIQFEKSSYPSVLTKAVEISLNALNSPKSGGNLLANVAQKMNTSTLDLASKLAETAEVVDGSGHLEKIVQGFMKNNAALPSNNITSYGLTGKKLAGQLKSLQNDPRNTKVKQNYAENEGNFEESSETSGLSTILQMILNKLDSIYDSNDKDDDEHPDGAPCDVIGSWSSNSLGLCFDIQVYNDRIRDISPAEINNKILLINSKECTPAKKHAQLIDLQWKFKGSALKQWGGPLYMYGQKRSENMAATFLGFCRTCGGIDTIFGSWNILSPSKDCNDISLAFNIKRDVLRRNLMERKRKERFKNVLYKNRLN